MTHSRMGGSFPISDWMMEGIETRTQRIKRKERERVLDEVIAAFDTNMPCHCIPEFRDRNLIDPQCERHDAVLIIEDLRNGL